MKLRMTVSALALGLISACSGGGSVSSPGTTPVTAPPAPGGGGTGGGTGGGSATCPTGFTEGTAVGGLTTCNLSGDILSDTTLTNVSGIAYRIDGRINVGIDTGADGTASGGTAATLTIEPGVTLFGSSGSDFVVVNRGSQIIADANSTNPIIFTSEDDLERQNDADTTNDDGGDNIGEWGGLVILGQAPINRCPSGTVGTVTCENAVEGVSSPNAVYGGTDASDSSGILDYVQVRFAGFELPPANSGNELNGITFAGVGDGTEVNFVQVHNNSDDGVEFFGGSVDVKYLVLTGNDDDSIDTDNGYNGTIQFAVVTQRAAGGDNINEASSTGAGGTDASNPSIANFTFVGNRTNAFRLNSGTIGNYINGIVSYGQECFRWQDAGNDNATFEAAGDPEFRSVLFDCAGGLFAGNSSANGQTVAPLAVAADTDNVQGANSLAGNFFPGPNEAGVTAEDPSAANAKFVSTDYIGAFSPTESETQNWASGWTFALFPEATCPVSANVSDSGLTLDGQKVCRVSGTITDDLRLTRGNIYEIDGRLNVGVDVGATGAATGGDPASLTIEAGVTLFGDNGADHLVVNRGSQIFANGTALNPVIFTSEDDLSNTQVDPANSIGEWGGLVLLGQAPINRCPSGTVGTATCENAVEGVSSPNAVYGGTEENDSTGSLTYVQVKYAGFELPPANSGNELNGITFGGIGDGTTVEYIQVHNNSDDGVEFFGGDVNVKYLVLTGNDDDSIDTDNGYDGNIQFAIVTQRSTGGDNIVEASSTGAGGTDPSNATISNFTFVGDRSNAFRLNSGTVGQYVNGVVDYGQECFRWQDAGNDNATFEAAGDPSFNSVLFDCAGGLTAANSAANGTTVAPLAVAADANNSTSTANSLASTFVNGLTEDGVTAFDVTTLDPFFTAVDYIGAVEDANDTWWQGWSCGLEASDPC